MEVRPGYRLTELGVIPEEWEVKPLRSVLARCRLGGNYPNQDRETSFPLIKMGNIGRGTIDTSKIEYIESSITPEPLDRLCYGDLLFNTRNTLDLVGKVAIWRDELPIAFYNSNLLRLEFNPLEVCSSEYANYALNSNSTIKHLRALATGTTSVAAIYTRDLLQLPFAVPPLPEQRAIAAALSDVDALISGLERLIEKKRAIKQGTMQELLTGKRRLPGFSGEWEVVDAGSLGQFRGGSGFPTAYQGYTLGDYPFFKVSDMNNEGNDTFMNTANNYITEAVRKRLGANAFPPNTVVLAKVGAAIFLERKKILAMHSCIDNNMAGFILCDDRIDYRYIHFFLLNFRLGSLVSTTALPSLNGNVLNAIKIPLPPTKAEQTAIAAVLSDIDAEITALEARRDKTRLLKQGMMQELLTGRIRLNHD